MSTKISSFTSLCYSSILLLAVFVLAIISSSVVVLQSLNPNEGIFQGILVFFGIMCLGVFWWCLISKKDMH